MAVIVARSIAITLGMALVLLGVMSALAHLSGGDRNYAGVGTRAPHERVTVATLR